MQMFGNASFKSQWHHAHTLPTNAPANTHASPPSLPTAMLPLLVEPHIVLSTPPRSCTCPSRTPCACPRQPAPVQDTRISRKTKLKYDKKQIMDEDEKN